MRCVTVLPLTADAAPTLTLLASELTPLIRAVPGFITFELSMASDGTAVIVDEYLTADNMIAANALTVSLRVALEPIAPAAFDNALFFARRAPFSPSTLPSLPVHQSGLCPGLLRRSLRLSRIRRSSNSVMPSRMQWAFSKLHPLKHEHWWHDVLNDKRPVNLNAVHNPFRTLPVTLSRGGIASSWVRIAL
jgi:hypothetical protein